MLFLAILRRIFGLQKGWPLGLATSVTLGVNISLKV